MKIHNKLTTGKKSEGLGLSCHGPNCGDGGCCTENKQAVTYEQKVASHPDKSVSLIKNDHYPRLE